MWSVLSGKPQNVANERFCIVIKGFQYCSIKFRQLWELLKDIWLDLIDQIFQMSLSSWLMLYESPSLTPSGRGHTLVHRSMFWEYPWDRTRAYAGMSGYTAPLALCPIARYYVLIFSKNQLLYSTSACRKEDSEQPAIYCSSLATFL